ncbi:MAG: KdsC family phosphatase [Bacteroidota bacterium]
MITKEISQKLSKVKLLVMDVDGTLTDSAMYYSKDGEELKRFSTRDGMGINLMHKAGLDTGIITSENSPIAKARADKLKIKHLVLNCRNKTDAFNRLCSELSLSHEETAYIGDDINDIHVMKLAGVSACPGDAADSVLKVTDYICRANGGNGAVREFCEIILSAQDKLITLEENW